MGDFNTWSPSQVGEWLERNGFPEYREAFEQHDISGDLLLHLDYPTLRDVGVLIVGDRARILQAVKKQFITKGSSSNDSSTNNATTSGFNNNNNNSLLLLQNNRNSISIGSSSSNSNRNPSSSAASVLAKSTSNSNLSSSSSSTSTRLTYSPSSNLYGSPTTFPNNDSSTIGSNSTTTSGGGGNAGNSGGGGGPGGGVIGRKMSLGELQNAKKGSSSSSNENLFNAAGGGGGGGNQPNLPPGNSSPIVVNRRINNISTSSGALKTTVREANYQHQLQQQQLYNQQQQQRSPDSHQQQQQQQPQIPTRSADIGLLYQRDAFRNQALRNQKEKMNASSSASSSSSMMSSSSINSSIPSSVKPLVIFPRSSSIKPLKTSASSNIHQELSDAVDSVFGGGPSSSNSSSLSPNASSSNNQTHLFQDGQQPASPSSPTSSSSLHKASDLNSEKDIMNMRKIREQCIRVYGIQNQSYIIKVADIREAKSLRIRILNKFNLPYTNEWQLFIRVNDNLIPLDDNELVRVCSSDNEHRGNLFLRNIVSHESVSPPPQDLSEGAVKSIQKISKFFGVDPSPQSVGKSPVNKRNLVIDSNQSRAISLFSPDPPASASAKSKLNKFFGERPPDELIVDQLEQFFPGIKSSNEASDAATQLKNIVQENLRNKRSSRRASSIMIRRQTQLGPKDAVTKPSRPQAVMVKKNDLIITTSVEELMNAASIEAPISADKVVAEPLSYDSQSSSGTSASDPPPPAKAEVAIAPSSTASQEPQPITFRWAPGSLIGQGAFGKVFHALNLDNGDFLAVKQVITGLDNTQQKKSNDSLQREIELLRELDHDNIVRYLGFQAGADNTFNVFLEYVAGGSIASVLAKCGKLDEQIARSFTAQILCGLEYLHSRDIIHRDIKGANILVTGDGIVKISDFGISKKNEYTAYHRMTRMSMQGSIHWMAPEVARGKGYSAKVDIWSCGCLVLEMLTGQVPWHKVRGNIIYLLGTGNAPPLPPMLSELAKHFLEVTFEIDPEKRPTATTLLNHVFTDIDVSTIDFYTWSTFAMQQRAELGSTSEEPSDDDEDSLLSESDEEDEEEEEEELFEEELNSPQQQQAQQNNQEPVSDNNNNTLEPSLAVEDKLIPVDEQQQQKHDEFNENGEEHQQEMEEDYEDYDDNSTPLPQSPHSKALPSIALDLDVEEDLYDFNGEVTESLEYLLSLPGEGANTTNK